jgi:hypothetical protein
LTHENPTEYSKRVTGNSRAGGAEVTFPIVFFERLSRFFLLSRRELLALALLFVVSLPAVTARLYSSDEVQYFSYLRSVYFDRDVSFENEYRYFYDNKVARSAGFHETFLERETAAGRRVNYGTLGAPLLWSPFYAAADAWTRATGSHEATGFTQPYVRAVAYGSAFYGFLAILLSIRAARLLVGPTGGFGAGLAVWVGTPLLFYMYVAPPFAHACSAFAVALFVNVWLHVRSTWSPRGAFALGLSAALMAMVREQDVFLALGPAVDFGLAFVKETGDRRQETGGSGRLAPGALTNAGLAGVIGTLAGYAPQLLAYNALNGYPGPASDVVRKMYWYAPHGLQVLASPQHGLFLWTPLAVVALLGLFFIRERIVAACLAVMVASQVYVAGSVDSWSVAGAFGHRRFVCITIILVIGLAALLHAAKGRARIAVLLLTAVMVWWNVALMAQFATRLMDRQRLEPARNAYHAFVTLPLSAPSLVYRYLTDRASFYESRPTPDVP